MAQKLSQELPDSSSFVADIDAEVLESSFTSKYSRKQGKDIQDTSPTSPTNKKSR